MVNGIEKMKMCKPKVFQHKTSPSLIGHCNLLHLSQIVSSFRLSTAVNFLELTLFKKGHLSNTQSLVSMQISLGCYQLENQCVEPNFDLSAAKSEETIN